MYKITLFDMNCDSVCSGVAEFFVDELKEFESSWLESKKVEDTRKNRYLESKKGKIVTDYYSNDGEYNIVQFDENAKIIGEKDYIFHDRTFILRNFYQFESLIYAKKSKITLRTIYFNRSFYLIGKYRLDGVCQKAKLLGYSADGWCPREAYGNPIHNISISKMDHWINEEGLKRYDWSKDKFSNDFIETYCWVTLGSSSEKDSFDINELDILSDELLGILMQDIPGDSG